MRKHDLSCDEYHVHRPPNCCSDSCWCKNGGTEQKQLTQRGKEMIQVAARRVQPFFQAYGWKWTANNKSFTPNVNEIAERWTENVVGLLETDDLVSAVSTGRLGAYRSEGSVDLVLEIGHLLEGAEIQ